MCCVSKIHSRSIHASSTEEKTIKLNRDVNGHMTGHSRILLEPYSKPRYSKITKHNTGANQYMATKATSPLRVDLAHFLTLPKKPGKRAYSQHTT